MASSHLDVATYQITYQLKILTTAAFSMVLLGRSFSKVKWVALVLLVAGVVTVNLSNVKEAKVVSQEQSRLAGFAAAFSACLLSGLSGVYFEKILKGTEVSVWMRNVQLSLLSMPTGGAIMMYQDGGQIIEKVLCYYD